MTGEEEIAGASVQPSKLARHNGNTSEGPCGSSCERLTLKERLTGAVLGTGHCKLYVKHSGVQRDRGFYLGNTTPDVTVPGRVFVRNLCYVIALLGKMLMFCAYFIQFLSSVELIAMVYFVLQIF